MVRRVSLIFFKNFGLERVPDNSASNGALVKKSTSPGLPKDNKRAGEPSHRSAEITMFLSSTKRIIPV